MSCLLFIMSDLMLPHMHRLSLFLEYGDKMSVKNPCNPVHNTMYAVYLQRINIDYIMILRKQKLYSTVHRHRTTKIYLLSSAYYCFHFGGTYFSYFLTNTTTTVV